MHRARSPYGSGQLFCLWSGCTTAASKAVPILIGGTSDQGVVASVATKRANTAYALRCLCAWRAACVPMLWSFVEIRRPIPNSPKLVTDIIREQVPILEKASIDEFYADLTGHGPLFGALQSSPQSFVNASCANPASHFLAYLPTKPFQGRHRRSKAQQPTPCRARW